MSKMLKVRILSQGRIPFLGGNGPILRPIFISEDQYKTLKILGYNVEVLKDDRPQSTPTSHKTSESVPVENEEDVVDIEYDEVPKSDENSEEENDLSEEVHNESGDEATEELTTEVEDEVTDEEEEVAYDEILVDDEDLSADAYYTFDFLTKKRAIKVLTNRGVEFNSNLNATPLKNLVLSTNPEIVEDVE